VPTFRVKLGANDLNCVDVPLNPTNSLQAGFPSCHPAVSNTEAMSMPQTRTSVGPVLPAAQVIN